MSNTISIREVFNKNKQICESEYEAAEATLDMMTNGLFVAVEEPKRSKYINKLLAKMNGGESVWKLKSKSPLQLSIGED